MSLSAMNGIRRVGRVIGEPRRERPRRTDDSELASPEPGPFSPPAPAPRNPRGTKNPSRMDVRALHAEGENGGYGNILSPTATVASANGGSNGRERQPRERGVGGRERGGRPPKVSPVAGESSWDAPPPVPRGLGGDTGNVWDVAPINAVSIGDMINAEKLRAQLDKAHSQVEKLEAQQAELRKRRSDSEADCGRLRSQLEAVKRREAELEDLVSRKDSQIASAGPPSCLLCALRAPVGARRFGRFGRVLTVRCVHVQLAGSASLPRPASANRASPDPACAPPPLPSAVQPSASGFCCRSSRQRAKRAHTVRTRTTPTACRSSRSRRRTTSSTPWR